MGEYFYWQLCIEFAIAQLLTHYSSDRIYKSSNLAIVFAANFSDSAIATKIY
ncbi:MAG: hypothetical protein AAGA60_07610 [Cyanobacteria bacterium P01_E01_bin.42]